MSVSASQGQVNVSDRNISSTFAKGLGVLGCFETGRADLTMSEIARLTGYDRATTRRLCLTLEAEGYIHRHGKFLRLTPKTLAVSGGYLTCEQIGRSVQPILNHFAQELQSEIALAVRDGTRALYVARSSVASARVSIGFSVGSTLPLLPTAVGRMLLASVPRADRDAVIEGCDIHAFTAKTEMDPASLSDKISKAAQQGFAHVLDEFEIGAAGLAIPVSPLSGRETVLATTTSVNKMSRPDQLNTALDILRSAAMSLRR